MWQVRLPARWNRSGSVSCDPEFCGGRPCHWVMENAQFCTSASIVQRLACRAISTSAVSCLFATRCSVEWMCWRHLAVDCKLADDWQPWSECDTRCGYGVQVRHRSILQDAVNGGRPCAATVERRQCEGTRCKLARSHHATVSQLKGTCTCKGRAV